MTRSMTPGDLLADLFTVVESDKNIAITVISMDNRDVNKVDLFMFNQRDNFDPHSDYQAIENKAHAFINDKHLNTDLPQFITEDTSHLIGLIAARFYGYPTESMTTIAVTGTNGNTSVIKLIS